MKLTVYYDGQYWVGVVEESLGGKLKASRYVFGAEPQDGEVLDFVNRKMLQLIKETQQTVEIKIPERKTNPKRLQRQAAKELHQKGISTAAQNAIKKELEMKKVEHKVKTQQQKEVETERKRQLKVQKAKEKHRGH